MQQDGVAYLAGHCVVLHMELSGIRYLKASARHLTCTTLDWPYVPSAHGTQCRSIVQAAATITWIVQLVGLAFLITALVLKISKVINHMTWPQHNHYRMLHLHVPNLITWYVIQQ
jgi:hypothetical protein